MAKKKTAKKSGNTPLVAFRVPTKERDNWQAKADAEGRTLSNWMRHHLNRAAGR